MNAEKLLARAKKEYKKSKKMDTARIILSNPLEAYEAEYDHLLNWLQRQKMPRKLIVQNLDVLPLEFVLSRRGAFVEEYYLHILAYYVLEFPEQVETLSRLLTLEHGSRYLNMLLVRGLPLQYSVPVHVPLNTFVPEFAFIIRGIVSVLDQLEPETVAMYWHTLIPSEDAERVLRRELSPKAFKEYSKQAEQNLRWYASQVHERMKQQWVVWEELNEKML